MFSLEFAHSAYKQGGTNYLLTNRVGFPIRSHLSLLSDELAPRQDHRHTCASERTQEAYKRTLKRPRRVAHEHSLRTLSNKFTEMHMQDYDTCLRVTDCSLGMSVTRYSLRGHFPKRFTRLRGGPPRLRSKENSSEIFLTSMVFCASLTQLYVLSRFLFWREETDEDLMVMF